MAINRINYLAIILVFLALLLLGCSNENKTAAPAEEEIDYSETGEETNEDGDTVNTDTNTQEAQDDAAAQDNVIIEAEKINYYTGENLIDNASAEIDYINIRPNNWYNKDWGNNDTKFSYLREGYLSNRSVKIEMTNYVDGDARWFFYPIFLEPGDYIFRDYYRSDVETNVKVLVRNEKLEKKYIHLKSAPASEEWAMYEAVFTMPEDYISATVYHYIAQDGYLITDDLYLTEYNYHGFENGMVTITFNGGWWVNYQTALPVMQEYGFESNQFYTVEPIRNAEGSSARETIQEFINEGHEIGSRTLTYADLSTLSEKKQTIELMESKLFLENYLGINVDCFSAPYGVYSEGIKEKIMEYYRAHRSIDYGYNSKDNFDAGSLMSVPIVYATTKEEFQDMIQKAKDEKLWLILQFNNISESARNSGVTPEFFAECMQIIDDSEIPVVTITEGLDIIADEMQN